MCLGRLFIAAALFAGTAAADEPQRTFSPGIYRQEGRCTRLIRLGEDQTASCVPWLGVWARQEDLPEFMFHHGDKKFPVFVASGPAEFFYGNTQITYPIATVVDLESKQKIEVFGECTLRIEPSRETVKCRTWNDHARSEPLFTAEFEGDGAWVYKYQR